VDLLTVYLLMWVTRMAEGSKLEVMLKPGDEVMLVVDRRVKKFRVLNVDVYIKLGVGIKSRRVNYYLQEVEFPKTMWISETDLIKTLVCRWTKHES